MEIDELLKSIEGIEQEIKNQFTVLGEQYFEKEFENAKGNYGDVVSRIVEGRDKIGEIKKQINVIKGIVICDNCGAEVKNTYTFCQECGNKIKSADEDVPEGFVLCGNCNAVMEEGSKFCVCCGQKIGLPEKKKVQEVPVTEAPKVDSQPVENKTIQLIQPMSQKNKKECPQCKELINEDDTFCISCGAIFSMPEMETFSSEEGTYEDDNSPVLRERECPKCGQKMAETDTICTRCGYTPV